MESDILFCKHISFDEDYLKILVRVDSLRNVLKFKETYNNAEGLWIITGFHHSADIIRYVMEGCFLMTKTFVISILFQKDKSMTQPSDSVYPKNHPPGSQKTSLDKKKHLPG